MEGCPAATHLSTLVLTAMSTCCWIAKGHPGHTVPALQILYGNLAPEGSVAKITGKEGLQFRGPARVFDSEEDMLAVVAEDPQQLKVLTAGSEIAPDASSIGVLMPHMCSATRSASCELQPKHLTVLTVEAASLPAAA